MDSIRQIISFPSRAAISTLLNYRSRHQDDLRTCRGTPDCAEYAVEAIARQGLLIGGARGCWRALRCRFSSRELDPVVSDASR